MKVVIPDDYQDAVRQLDCFAKLAAHDVKVYSDSTIDDDVEALVLIRERTPVTAELLDR
ncbi:MAG TPA: D-2-hydroxyacid dehydrogenase family protein, partial [Thermoanaerobaculia bacterium]|nr:D-2-hydroxyacid dehydrogenase family protein [Thermoanaerobaculia bacterium]